MATIVITSDFFDSFCLLPRSVQDKVKDFFSKFGKNPRSLGLNLEKINKINDKQLYSARIDDKYRAIIYKDTSDETYMVLWVDNHDEAYDWARAKKELNLTKIGSVINPPNGLSQHTNANLFSKISTKNLLALGVPSKDLALVRNISDLNALYQIRDVLPSDVFSNLEWLGIDIHVQLIVDNNKRTKEMVLDYIKQEVLYPAINHQMLDDDIKSSVRDTMARLENKKSVREISEFFEDALIAKRGKEVYTAFKKIGLKAFEDIVDDVRQLCI